MMTLRGWVDDLSHDLRYGLRMLWRAPAFTGVALLTLALGIGANAAMFSIVNGVLLRPLPYAESDRLVRVYQANPTQDLRNAPISFPDFEDWRDETRSFAAMAAYFNATSILTGRGNPLELESSFVTDDFFAVLGTPVQLGRPLLPDDVLQASHTAVISDRLWRMSFAADPAAIGSSLVLGGNPYTVVGVMPSSFVYPTPDTDVWAPESLLTEHEIGPRLRQFRMWAGVARLKEGVSLEQSRGELNTVAARLAARYADNTGWTAATVVPLRTVIVGDVDRALVVVLGVVGFILLIGCANLANLLLARGAARSNEIAIRTALGAGRMRIVRQLLSESLVLALLGGLLGLVLAVWGVKSVLALSADTLPRIEDVRIDGRVIGFGLILTLVTGMLFGLLPALRAAHASPQNNLKGGRGTVGRGQRLRSALVVAEVGLAVLLVIGAGLMARSFLALRSVDPGFNPERVLTVTIQLNLADVTGPSAIPGLSPIASHILLRRREIIERVGMLPGVVEVGAVNSLPLKDERWEVLEFRRADGTGTPDGGMLRADRSYISADYLETMGIPLLRGQLLPQRWERAGPYPILLSETAARRFWPDQDPVGQIVRHLGGQAVVVGVVGDVRHLGLAQEPSPAVYVPQAIGPRILTTVVVRTAGEPLALADPIRQTIREIDPNQPIRTIATLGAVMSESIARDRFFTFLFGAFGVLALVLAAVGVYGVLAYSVSQRTEEIGVRMALGAGAADILWMIVGGGMLLVVTGSVLGALASLWLTRVMQSQLYGVSTTDPATLLISPGVLAVVALLACYFPARRATRIDPSAALRPE